MTYLTKLAKKFPRRMILPTIFLLIIILTPFFVSFITSADPTHISSGTYGATIL